VETRKPGVIAGLCRTAEKKLVCDVISGTDPGVYTKAKAAGHVHDIPTNHNPRFAPVIHPTLETGVEALLVAAKAWLAK
jgi:hypothetical protein